MVAEEIRRNILHKSLKAEERLPTENELTKQLGVGRPTIREALRILQGQGWIKFKFSGGAYIMDNAKISQKSLPCFQILMKNISPNFLCYQYRQR